MWRLYETIDGAEVSKLPVLEPWLCRYLKQRRIEKIFKAIGFKNNAGGYELRNEYFKGSSCPKYISYFNKCLVPG